ncbi:MAG: DUF4153 domain-containing protein [Ignavibacteria bacterium]|nr:DUF4153 domain-containing protein [Ignavibacteria bacterium]
MKLQSLSNLYNESVNTFKRFPFVILNAVLLTLIMIYFAEFDTEQNITYFRLMNGAMAASIGIPVLFALAIFSESYNHSRKISYLLQAAGIILLAVFYYSMSREENFYDGSRYMMYFTAAHLLVSFSMFKKDEGKYIFSNFWDFNLKLFLRILISAFYSLVLFAGLAIALVSFDKLFNMDIKEERYLQLFFLIAGIFNTWFFLSGVPKKEDEITAYPNALKIFTQYVAIPIVVVYLIILYLYTGKIILAWQLPVGWVSNLIIGFSIAGIFALLLVHPIKNTENNKWILIFGKVFYFILIPLIILLYTAILRRISEYGITENRYYIFVAALWLTGIALYFIFSKEKNIKIIPISLFIIILFASFGPWGAFSVSLNNQLGRFEHLLTKNNILVDGKITKTNTTVSPEDNDNIFSILGFLEMRKQYSEIQPWFDISLDSIAKEDNYIRFVFNSETAIMKYMGLEYNPNKIRVFDNNYEYRSKDLSRIDVSGYNYVYYFRNYESSDTVKTISYFNYDVFKVQKDTGKKQINVSFSNDSGKTYSDTIKIDMPEIFENLKTSTSSEYFYLDKEGKRFKFRMYITYYTGEMKNNIFYPDILNCVFLFGKL